MIALCCFGLMEDYEYYLIYIGIGLISLLLGGIMIAKREEIVGIFVVFISLVAIAYGLYFIDNYNMEMAENISKKNFNNLNPDEVMWMINFRRYR